MTEAVVNNPQNPVTNYGTDSDGSLVPLSANTDGSTPITGTRFTPSIYGATVAMDGTAQSEAIATGTTVVQVVNLGATTEDLRAAFGESASAAEANLTHSSDHATTGYYIPAATQGNHIAELGVPSTATHIAYENATASDTQDVIVNQGI
jgi:hypothetical protein